MQNKYVLEWLDKNGFNTWHILSERTYEGKDFHNAKEAIFNDLKRWEKDGFSNVIYRIRLEKGEVIYLTNEKD